MKKEKLTKKIMFRVASKEEARLKKALYIALPVLLMVILINALSMQHTFDRLIEKDFFTLIRNYDLAVDKIIPQSRTILGSLIEEIFEGVLAIWIISICVILLIIIKTDLASFPKRFKETRKYKK